MEETAQDGDDLHLTFIIKLSTFRAMPPSNNLATRRLRHGGRIDFEYKVSLSCQATPKDGQPAHLIPHLPKGSIHAKDTEDVCTRCWRDLPCFSRYINSREEDPSQVRAPRGWVVYHHAGNFLKVAKYRMEIPQVNEGCGPRIHW